MALLTQLQHLFLLLLSLYHPINSRQRQLPRPKPAITHLVCGKSLLKIPSSCSLRSRWWRQQSPTTTTILSLVALTAIWWQLRRWMRYWSHATDLWSSIVSYCILTNSINGQRRWIVSSSIKTQQPAPASTQQQPRSSSSSRLTLLRYASMLTSWLSGSTRSTESSWETCKWRGICSD